MADAQETITESLTACTLGGEEAAGAPVSRKMVPETYNYPVVIRTDFSDQQAWEAVVTAIRAPYPEGVEARVHFLDDPAFQGLTATQLQDLIPEAYTSWQPFLMVVDHVTINEPEHPIVIVNVNEFDDSDWHGRQFRFVPAAMRDIENALWDTAEEFEEIAVAVDEDGVLRPFRDKPTTDDTELPTQ